MESCDAREQDWKSIDLLDSEGSCWVGVLVPGNTRWKKRMKSLDVSSDSGLNMR